MAKLKKSQVKDMQWLLKDGDHNRHGIQTYSGKVDGVAGPRTREAWRKARWLLGFPQQSYRLPATGGRWPYTRALLLPMRHDGHHNKEAKALPDAFKTRRRHRVRLKPRPKVGGNAVVEWASREVGTHESGGANTGSRVRYYQAATWLGGTGWPWCAAFVCRCWREVYGSVPRATAGAWDFTDNSGIRVPVSQIRAGDAVSYNTGSGHINIATGPPSNGRIPTIGGNEGDSVKRSSWPVSMVHSACRHPKAV
jgi:CHAP domain